MKLQEGPLFGALIIGFGIGFLTFNKTNNIGLGVLLGLAVSIADYVLICLLYTSPSPRDATLSRMPSSA